jgi:hypothetical protein
MKLSLKDLVKLIAPYIVAIGFIKVNAYDYAPLANETFYSPEM